jgi:hypothetical protein
MTVMITMNAMNSGAAHARIHWAAELFYVKNGLFQPFFSLFASPFSQCFGAAMPDMILSVYAIAMADSKKAI